MKKLLSFVLLLVLCVVPVQVFAATSEKDAHTILEEFGLAPSSDPSVYNLFNTTNYTLEGDKLANFKMINAAYKTENTISVNCDDLYSSNEKVTVGGGKFYAYKVDDYGRCYVGDATAAIKYDAFNAKYKGLYGTDAPKTDIVIQPNFSTIIYDYNASIDAYVKLLPPGGAGAMGGSYFDIFKIRSVKDTDTGLDVIVSTETIYEQDDKYSFGKVEIPTSNDKEAIEKKIYDEYINEVKIYTVSLTKSGSNYILKSITKYTGPTITEDVKYESKVVKVDDTSAFSPYVIYVIGIGSLLFGAFLWSFAKKSNKLIKED